MAKTYVIVDLAHRFAAVRGGNARRVDWVAEYPDATVWTSASAARKTLADLKRGGHCLNVYSLVEDYGLESQTTLDRVDMLA